MKKFLCLLMFIFCLLVGGCGVTEEECKEKYPCDECKECTELNKENCAGYCDVCTEINKETCDEYCDECTELNKETCNDYCDECTELNKETCKDYCDECPEWTEEECSNKYPHECPEWTKEECEEKYPEEVKEPMKLGIDRIDEYLSVFEGKKVGLITNPTGLNSNYESSIDVLFEKVNLTALYAPEHGIRGDSQAGGSIGNEVDVKTNLTVYSLYGNTQKPTKAMLSNIDVMCFDIQDVGARFYTYIYTMAYAMEACAENGKEFVVFDRPNPVSADVVQGNILDEAYSSFIGLYPIVQRHGMTVGEIARLFNTEFGINCDLTVIKMANYDRTSYYDDTNLPWVTPSPNMPTVKTAVVYTATCLFEGTNVSEGRGTTTPFELIGAPYINPFKLSDELNKLNLPGVYFRPAYFTPTFNKHANVQCGGVQVHVTNRDEFLSVYTGFAMIKVIRTLYPNDFVINSASSKRCTLNLNTGCDYITKDKYSLDELKEILANDEAKFKETRSKYLLY